MNILQWIMEHKWAITPSALETILAIVEKDNSLSIETIAKSMHGSAWDRYLKDGEFDFGALEGNDYPILDGTRRVSFADGIALLPVVGPIFPRANLMTMSGGVSVQSLSYDFNVALKSSSVDAIILNIDSPGGEITGINDFADMIYNARNVKPIIAYVYGLGASAAYWIASSASEIVVSSTAELGSIGVVAGYTDRSKEQEKRGIQNIEIVSSNAPNKRPDPSTTGGRAQIQELVDNLESVFTGTVARNRGITQEQVLSDFGQGKMFVGETAISQGLADRIGSLEGLVTELQDRTKKSEQGNYNLFTGGSMDVKTLQEQHPELFAQVKALGRKEAEETASAKIEQARKEGAEAENARIKAIEEISVPGASKIIAEHKFDMTKTADNIAGLVLKAQKEGMEKMQDGLKKDGEELANLSAGLGQGETPEASDVDKNMVGAIAGAMNSYNR